MLPDNLKDWGKEYSQDEEMSVSDPKLCGSKAFEQKTIDGWAVRQENVEEGVEYDQLGMVPESYAEIYERRFAFDLLGKRLKGCHFLDIGGGTLRFAIKAAENGCEFSFGIDLRPGRLKHGLLKAKKQGILGSIIPVVADARFLPFQDNVFDFIMCIEVIEHIAENARSVFEEIRRLLKHNGVAIVNVWNAITMFGTDRKKIGIREYIREGDSYYRYYYPWEFYRLYKSTGFRRTKLCGALIPKTRSLAARLGKDQLLGRLAIEEYLSNLAPIFTALFGELTYVRLVK